MTPRKDYAAAYNARRTAERKALASAVASAIEDVIPSLRGKVLTFVRVGDEFREVRR